MVPNGRTHFLLSTHATSWISPKELSSNLAPPTLCKRSKMHDNGIVRREKEPHIVPTDARNQDSLLDHFFTLQIIIFQPVTQFNKNVIPISSGQTFDRPRKQKNWGM